MKGISPPFTKTVLHCLFVIINIIILILLILPSLTTNLGLWWLDNLVNLQIQWTLIALLLIVVNLLYIRKLRVVSTLLYALLMMLNLVPLYIHSSPAVAPLAMADNQHLNIAQINLRYDNPNLIQLLPILGNKNYDLLIIQEASDEKHRTIQQLANYYPYSFGIDAHQATPDGMAIFSRWPLVEKHLHQLGEQHGQLLEVVLQKESLTAPIQIFALHPVSPRNAKLWQRRNETLAMTAEVVAASPFANQLVVGDFNSSPWSIEFKDFLHRSQLSSSANGFGYIASWSYSDNPLFSLLSSAYIDHHLVSDNFSVLNKQALPIPGSDHQMVLTQLQLTH